MWSLSNTGSRPGLPLLVYVAAAWIAAVDSPSLISLGPISLSGGATLVLAASAVLLAPAYWVSRQRGPGRTTPAQTSLPLGFSSSAVPWPLTAFLLWAFLSLMLDVTRSTVTSAAVQNVAVYLAFGGALAVATSANVSGAAIQVRRLFLFAGWIAVGMTLIGVVVPRLVLYGPRSVALTLLLVEAVAVPDRSRRLAVRFLPFACVIAVGLTLSRTALMISALMLSFLVVRGRRGSRVLRGCATAAAILGLFWLLVDKYEPLRQRFVTGDNYTVGGMEFNTSGRAEIWAIVLRSIQRGNAWLGQGPGTAEEVLKSYGINDHPHNDYLRIAHDFGYVGLILFAVGYLWLLGRSLRAASLSPDDRASVHWSSVLALAAIAVAAVTDNVLVYVFVMVPLGVMVGLSMGCTDGEVEQLRPLALSASASSLRQPWGPHD